MVAGGELLQTVFAWSTLFLLWANQYVLVCRLGSAEREAHVYSMLNVPLNSHTRNLCEHQGRFDILHTVMTHLR
jgi:hypothetical protein